MIKRKKLTIFLSTMNYNFIIYTKLVWSLFNNFNLYSIIDQNNLFLGFNRKKKFNLFTVLLSAI